MADAADLSRWIELGLFDPEDPNATERAPVLEFFNQVGVDPAEFVGVEASQLIRVVNERLLRPGRRLTFADVQQATGIEDEQLAKLCRASGYAVDGEFTDLDVEAFKAFGIASNLFTSDELMAFSRVLAAAMAQVAEAATGLFHIDVTSAIEARGGSELEYAQSNQQSQEMIGELWLPIKAFFFNQLIQSVHRNDQARERVTSGRLATLKLAVGFVDIVGYTPMTAALDAAELAAFVLRFEELAFDTVAAHGGRVVKLIGDEVMFVAVDAEAAIAIAADLVTTFRDADATPRGGVSLGEVVSRGGDYYGVTVNQAARIAAEAIPGEVLVDAATAASAPGIVFTPAGRRMLKGFSEPVEVVSVATD